LLTPPFQVSLFHVSALKSLSRTVVTEITLVLIFVRRHRVTDAQNGAPIGRDVGKLPSDRIARVDLDLRIRCSRLRFLTLVGLCHSVLLLMGLALCFGGDIRPTGKAECRCSGRLQRIPRRTFSPARGRGGE
jgi:hypothetical protein